MEINETRLKNFTPLLDSITEKHGIYRASVFGRIYRYCQMSTGTCTASLERIAEKLGISYKTVQRHVKALVTDGYLEDLTPKLKNRPHQYRDTGKAGVKVTAEAFDNGYETPDVGDTEPQTASTRSESPSTKTLSPSGSVRESDEESIKETLKESIKKDSRSNDRGRKDSIRKALQQEFVDSTKLRIPSMQTAKQTRAAGELWWAPLQEIAKLTEWDERRGQSLVRLTVIRMRKDNLTISSPKSILNVAKAIEAEGRTAHDPYEEKSA